MFEYPIGTLAIFHEPRWLFRRDARLADGGITKREAAMPAAVAAAGPMSDQTSSITVGARKPRPFNGHTKAKRRREKAT